MRIVFDSNILIRSFISKGGLAHQLMLAAQVNDHTIVVSAEILREVADVLRNSRLASLHGLSEDLVYSFIASITMVADVVQLDPISRAPIRDPKDMNVIRTALAGPADILCTRDRDFFEPPASAFLASLGIEVLTDEELIKRLRR